MRVCLPLDLRPGSEVPLAAFFEAAHRLAPDESLVICPTERTMRLYPLFEAWALDEGHEFAPWRADEAIEGGAPHGLVGFPPRLLFLQGVSVEFRICSLESLSGAHRIAGR